ncbi:MAG: AAA family ATPase [Bacteroidales bacterium]|nr:AAA family ATPase [Bacteroidales bacterium]
MEIGGWRLEIGVWRLKIGDWRLGTWGWRVEVRDWGVEDGDWGLDICDLLNIGGIKMNTVNNQAQGKMLERYAVNLNERARSGKLDPVIGRDDEIRRVLQILSRRTKNNPILVGEPGVGKTAIAEGLAQRIVHGDVAENLKGKVIYSLDMGALIAGAKYQGEFEERLKGVVKEVVDSNGEIILYIDEIHTLVGAGQTSGAMDAANILKPALSRGELRCVGSTTLDEYQKYFEKDKALERRFQMVMVDEPSPAESISILRGLKPKYENHHKVKIEDDAIIAAVELSHRYITNRHLPDKAIDLIDEAAAKLRLEMNSVPEEIDEIQRKVKQLEIEKEAIRREGTSPKLTDITNQLEDQKKKLEVLDQQWKEEKKLYDSIQTKRQEIDSLNFQAETAERNGDYAKVAELRYGKIAGLQKEIEELHKKIESNEHRLIDEQVGPDDIAEIVAKWTGIPVSKMMQSEKDKLLHLEEELHKRVVGQDEAIKAVADAVRRSRAGLQSEKRPIGSFLFLGTTGVGKTELAKALAEFLFDDENMMTRIDMSEYQERFAATRLVGAPPGYVGYEEGGQLTEAVRRKPYSVVLFDEIEKAHPDVFNILLQVLDDGRLTDGKGRTVNFKNTILIMTSNVGSDIIQEYMSKMKDLTTINLSDEKSNAQDAKAETDNDGSSAKASDKYAEQAISNAYNEQLLDECKEKVLALMKRTVRPEFLNRIDEIIMFRPLGKTEIRGILKLQIAQAEKLLEGQNIRLRFTEEALNYLTNKGFDISYGARPIKRVLQKEVINTVAKAMIAGKVVKGSTVTIDYLDGGLLIK